MQTLPCSICGKEVELPAVLDEEHVVEDGKVIRSTLANGELERKLIPVYCLDCFNTAVRKSRENEAGPTNG